MNGDLVAEEVNGVKRFHHNDHLGSTSVVTDINGNVVENTTYDPYGAVISGGSASKLGYEAKEHDSVTGDTDFHFRQYQSEYGFFAQPDTLIQNVYDPQSLNRYLFERGNPYNRVDPDGHNPIIAYAAIASFIVGATLYWMKTPIDKNNPQWADRFAYGAVHGGNAMGHTVLMVAGSLGVTGGILRFTAASGLKTAVMGAIEGSSTTIYDAMIDNERVSNAEIGVSAAGGALGSVTGPSFAGQFAPTKNVFTRQTAKWTYGYAQSTLISQSMLSIFNHVQDEADSSSGRSGRSGSNADWSSSYNNGGSSSNTSPQSTNNPFSPGYGCGRYMSCS